MSIGEKLQTIAANEKAIYNSAYANGRAEGYDQGYQKGYDNGQEAGFTRGYDDGVTAGTEKGRQAEYDRFWVINQEGGNRTNYQYAYVGWGYSFANFYPKYDIRPTAQSNHMFYGWHENKDQHGSLKKRLEECGVVLDTTQSASLTQMFCNGYITELPAIVLPGGIANIQIFARNPYLVTIEKVIVDEKTTFTNCFDNDPALANVVFEGVIAQNGLDLSGSPLLTHESLMSTVKCLKDHSGSGIVYTVTLGAANLAKLTDEEKAIATEKGWILV